MREKFNEAIRGTALATTIAAVVSCSFEIAKVEFPPDPMDGGRSSDLMDASGNDLPEVKDMVINFDRQVGDILENEDLQNSLDGSTNSDGGGMDIPLQDGSILDGSALDFNRNDLVAPADLVAEKPDQAIASILEVTGTGCKKVFIFDRQKNTVTSVLGGDDGKCENNPSDKVTVDLATQGAYVWVHNPVPNRLEAKWLGDPMSPPSSFGAFGSIPMVAPQPPPWAPKATEVEGALKNAAFNGLGNLLVLPSIALESPAVGVGRGYAIR